MILVCWSKNDVLDILTHLLSKQKHVVRSSDTDWSWAATLSLMTYLLSTYVMGNVRVEERGGGLQTFKRRYQASYTSLKTSGISWLLAAVYRCHVEFQVMVVVFDQKESLLPLQLHRFSDLDRSGVPPFSLAFDSIFWQGLLFLCSFCLWLKSWLLMSISSRRQLLLPIRKQSPSWWKPCSVGQGTQGASERSDMHEFLSKTSRSWPVFTVKILPS